MLFRSSPLFICGAGVNVLNSQIKRKKEIKNMFDDFNNPFSILAMIELSKILANKKKRK